MIDIVDGTKAMTRKDLVELIEQQTGMLDQADAALNDLRTELSEAKAEIEGLHTAIRIAIRANHRATIKALKGGGE